MNKKVDVNLCGFVTDYSKDITEELFNIGQRTIFRPSTVHMLNNLLLKHELSSKIETSIFEFTLIQILKNNYDPELIEAIYEDKKNDVINNINEKHYLKNNTLKKKLLNNEIDPIYVAWLSPSELHPERWAPIIEQIELNDKTEKDMSFTDLYTCKKCGERKSHVSEIQMRCADEPMTKFVTCLICYNTFKY